ncbi:S-layer homology domain-containing protein [Anaerotignum lactatifermentans]|uniref:S-layer homology domain-containing protein n=1 Tax=Anaerotignum lactatifermentans TaxID=160404 RepID=A0ABS2GCA5_9FIRM|nr:S-layer homology domain-containing protein [Anaerotignum lactatifermentans]MBM6830231.1 S-layer homology domain-containing protein [Anaerotignum lactatifermentans]MBM6878780.1 S-layer homology domain-containing protein [Anaerotignum lactatifermentans]MBM6951844.1 S-layer homology domain-containing protein [Anaerotignum lactatifermentans]
MKKIITFATTAALLLGSTGVTAFGSTFADIDTVPWPGAATFLDQAASLGLMSGYTEDGKKYCKPRNPVTYCEATQLMYSIMKTYTKQDVTSTTITKWTPIMQAYKIPTWAYNAVAYALENGILITNDLSEFMSGTTQKNAPREKVGVIFGKALGKIYTVDTSAKLTYKDAASITASAAPYLDLLYDKNIMVGDDMGNFNPKVNINRAEMAVLSVKTYNTLTSSGSQTQQPETPSSGTVSCTVVSASLLSSGELFLSLKTSSGSGLNLFAASSIKPTYNGETVSLSDIGKDDTLSVTYSGDQIKSLTITKSAGGIGSSQSYDEIKKISSTKIYVLNGSKEYNFYLDDDVKVTIDGSSSTLKKLTDGLDDDKVYSVKLRLDKDEYVIQIDATENNNNPRTGTLTYLDSDELTIKAGSKEYDYDLADDDITVSGGSSMTFSKLKRDYEDYNYNVTLTLNSSNKVTKITINSAEDEENGILTYINSNRLTIKAGSKEYDYRIDEDVKVTIDGKSGSLSTLKDNYKSVSYRVSLTLDRDDYVTKIEATKDEESVSEGTLTYMSSSYIKIEDKDEKEYKYDVLDDTDDIDVTIDGKSFSYDQLRDRYKDSTYEVELTFKSGEVSKIKATNKDATKGELRDIDLDDETIIIRVDSRNKTYDLASDVTVTIDGSSSSLSKLDREFNDYGYNFTVELTLDSKDRVTKIKATDSDSGDTVKGDLDKLTSLYITVDDEKYYFADDVDDITFIVDDRTRDYDWLYDAFYEDDDDFRVTLTLNSKDEVTKVTATTR